MNLRTRRRQTIAAIDMLMEVVEDVLREAQDNGEGGLTMTNVPVRAGFPDVGEPWRLAKYILDQLEIEGTAENAAPGPGPDAWQPAN